MFFLSDRRRLLLLCGGIAVAAGLGALFALPPTRSPEGEPPPGDAPAPVLSVDAAEWDFGTVRRDSGTLTHTFTISNHGDVAITLKPVHLGCNCLAVDCPDVVAPGARCPFTVNLEVRPREGAFATRVVLQTSDPGRVNLEFLLKYFLPAEIEIDPPSFRFSEVKRGATLEREFHVFTRHRGGEGPPARPAVESDSPAVSCEHLDTRFAGLTSGSLRRVAHRYRLRVNTKLLPQQNPVWLPQVLRARQAGDPTDAAKSVSVEVRFLHHPFLIGQTSLTVQRGDKGKEVRIRLWSLDGKPFTVIRTVCTLPEVSVRAARSEPGELQDVLVSHRPPADDRTGETKKGFIDVYCSQGPDVPYRVNVLVLP